RGSRTRSRRAAARRAAAFLVATRRAAHAFAGAEQLHFAGDDVGRLLLDPVLVGVLAVRQASFDVDRGPLLHVLTGDLGQAVEEGDAMPLRLLHELAGSLVLAAAGGGQADVGDGLPRRQV